MDLIKELAEIPNKKLAEKITKLLDTSRKLLRDDDYTGNWFCEELEDGDVAKEFNDAVEAFD